LLDIEPDIHDIKYKEGLFFVQIKISSDMDVPLQIYRINENASVNEIEDKKKRTNRIK